jgi:hypothetical protein
MYSFREYLVKGDCPYCGVAFSDIINKPQIKYIRRCKNKSCGRGLTITCEHGFGFVEMGLPCQLKITVDQIYKGCASCGD